MARTRWAAVLVAAALVASVGLAGCGLSQGTVVCSMAPGPTNPVEVTRYRAYGAVVVVGTVGERVGRTRTFTPGYRTDVHALDVERVVAIVPGPDSGDAPVTASDVDAISRVGNVHYPDQPPSCGGKAENASFHEGDRVVLILGPPQPTADLWTVGPAVAVLDVAGERGSETATWRRRTSVGEGGCDGHLTYDLDRLEAAIGAADPLQPTAGDLVPTCTSD